jgi:glycosyltransferase involved in cell wall biosynthesis
MKYSIILCTFNSQRVIKEVIESAVNQQIKKNDLEIILADYKSIDDTVNIVKKISNKNNIKFTKLSIKKKGKSNSLVSALDFAKGEYAIILDDDNILFSNFIKEAEKFLKKNKNVGCLGSQGIVDKKLFLPSWFDKYKSHYAIGTIPQGSDWVWGACSIIKISAWKSLRVCKFQFYINPTRKKHTEPISQGGEDGELALAMILNGYKVKFNSKQKFIHKFSQDRLNQNFFLNNFKGTSESIPILEIYRTLKYNLTVNQLKLIWIFRILKIILYSLIKLIINLILIKKLELEYNFILIISVLKSFLKKKGLFHKMYNNLIKIKKFD